MKPFLGRDFLLNSDAAVRLYHEYAADMPIVDYHCHVSPQEMFEDKHFENITQVWLAGDHYKWRLMRSNGVDEYYITGPSTDWEKFEKFAEALPRAIGNPMYHWCHLELKKYFGYEGILSPATAREVWDLAAARLAQPDMGVRGIIAASNVAFIGTTDDPADSLEWHEKLAADPTMKTVVAPSFRPDKAINIDKAGWLEYIRRLESVCGFALDSIAALKKALTARVEFFAAHGCRASDHGLDRPVYREATEEELNTILRRALAGEPLTDEECEAYKTCLLAHCAREYCRLGMVMQLHYNCMRNPNTTMFARIGPDTGFDCIGTAGGELALARFLDAMDRENTLPRTILYSLNENDNAFLDSLIGSFQGPGVRGKIQHGSAWWFNDNLPGMRVQMTSLAQMSILGNFVGMLTDSRSFLSYTRHEYFRRLLCDILGGWMENGEYPADFDTVGALVRDISYNNAVRYFNLEV